MKKRANSKQKGNRFELEISKIFTSIFESEFRRTPNSGAYTGGANRRTAQKLREDAREILSGDIIGPLDFPFLIECKHYANSPSLHKVIAGEDKKLDEWIVQNDGDAAFVGKESLIVFRINNKGTFFVINENSDYLGVEFESSVPYIAYKGKFIMHFDAFSTAVTIEKIKEIIDIDPTQ